MQQVNANIVAIELCQKWFLHCMKPAIDYSTSNSIGEGLPDRNYASELARILFWGTQVTNVSIADQDKALHAAIMCEMQPPTKEQLLAQAGWYLFDWTQAHVSNFKKPKVYWSSFDGTIPEE